MERFLTARGPGFHHVTFKVADIHVAAAAVRSIGLTVVALKDSLASWKEMFLHPREAQGVVVQLAESHPEIGDDGWTAAWPYPRGEHEGGRPQVIGLRLRSRSAIHARAQWEALLGAEVEERHELLRFRWPGSLLCVSVEIVPEAAEGPVALEILDDSAPARRTGRIEALGCNTITVDR